MTENNRPLFLISWTFCMHIYVHTDFPVAEFSLFPQMNFKLPLLYRQLSLKAFRQYLDVTSCWANISTHWGIIWPVANGCWVLPDLSSCMILNPWKSSWLMTVGKSSSAKYSSMKSNSFSSSSRLNTSAALQILLLILRKGLLCIWQLDQDRM